MLLPTLIVFVGGSLGAIVRELCMLLLGSYSGGFPLDIFVANILASFLLGLVFGLKQEHLASANVNLLIATGFCGGMSTFSSFIYGSFSELTRPGEWGLALLYIIASLVVGYAAVWLGFRMAARAGHARHAGPWRQT